MASGNTLVEIIPQAGEAPSSNSGRPDTRNQHPVIDLALNEEERFSALMPRHYASGGTTVYIHIAMSSAVANDIKLEVSFERIGEVQNLDSDGFAAAQNTGDITVPGNSGDVKIILVTFTDGAQMDSIAVGEGFRINNRDII